MIERTQARGVTWQVSPDLMGALNAKGYFETSNPAWKALLGWTEEEVASMSIFELLHPDDVERTKAGFALTQQGQSAAPVGKPRAASSIPLPGTQEAIAAAEAAASAPPVPVPVAPKKAPVPAVAPKKIPSAPSPSKKVPQAAPHPQGKRAATAVPVSQGVKR